ncbi:long-chain-fatty-acid--CoA ligase [Alteriqipengyuania flavescens]|uniref:long-chain-fatty-acid--CoA ligase n=1 Tax=Alteriqipengyuania flavescens TaxID=3053610 RepID=UPI0025B2D639|nr:long-chain-fatty-acid--CoA ligase [Alteriqipengyuania flavescens]WJY18751.1 long-chain-fatty-acid--CoA ligase [Alteriqipengyuania flavescens]WJY24691.1 long-chain-fatty-acid--CoA ligase [Alteriqipengyuania flavescens]
MDEILSFDAFLRHWAKEKPDAVALEQDGRTQSWRELEDNTARVAAMLVERGLAKGDRIAWLGKNSDLYFTLFYGAARLGVVMAPVGWRLAPAEVRYILEDTGAKLLFTCEDCSGAAEKAVEGIAEAPAIISPGEAWQAIGEAGRTDFVAAGPDDAVLQLYTSGTTGKPKGAVLSNRNLFSLRLPGEEAGVPWAIWEEDEAILVCMPCAHIGGTGLGVMAMSAGKRALVQSEFNPDWVLDSFAQGITRLFIVPAALQMVVQHPRAKETDFSAVRFVMYGAAPIPLELLREAVRTIPNAGFVQVYGMTETTGTISALPPEDHTLEGNQRMRSAGKAVPGAAMMIVGEDGAELPSGEIGELLIKSPSNMLEYWGKPDATAEALKGGWMHTGDAAYMDDDGYVYIQDRIKDMIISGGENVYPAEVESAIYGHPAIAEVAVIGVPDEKWGEAVKACVVCKPGHELTEADVIAYAREQVAAYKVPKSVDLIAEMPRNPSGKILRRELRAPYWEGRDRQVN